MLFLYYPRLDEGVCIRMESAKSPYERFVIKSFKHDGSLHRVWRQNWQVPAGRLHPEHAGDKPLWVYLNDHTPIVEKDGKEWVSKVPAVSFFFSNEWFNVVALLETSGVRYYCNLASPPYRYGDVLTYIDYDLDLVVFPDGSVREYDRDEFVRHKAEYRYGDAALQRIDDGLRKLRERIRAKATPFADDAAHRYYEQWKTWIRAEGGHS